MSNRSSRGDTARRGGVYRCTACEAEMARWVGRCPECRAWGSVVERAGAPRRSASGGGLPAAGGARSAAVAMSQVSPLLAEPVPTGIAELDRALGGGLVPGSVVLLAGEPGIGKSTLLLDVAHRFAAASGPSLVVTGEESVEQVRLRAHRTSAVHDRLFLAAETSLSAVLAHVESVAPGLLVVDSVQTVAHDEADGVPGGVTHVRAVTSALVTLAKTRGMTTVIVGHVTKDGSVAGPRTLEHLVDVVLSFEGDRQTSLRLVRATKNRYGASDEVGCFEMTAAGMVEVNDPARLFVSAHAAPVAGTCVGVSLEGRRPIVAEIQSLVASTPTAPRRAVSGLDSGRMAMVLAVAERRAGIRLATSDVFLATVGGIRVVDPSADLAALVAVASGARDHPLPTGVAAIGEVGLAGDIRPVRDLERRVAELDRLGFRHVLVPPGTSLRTAARCVPVATAAEAVGQAFRLHTVPPLRVAD